MLEFGVVITTVEGFSLEVG